MLDLNLYLTFVVLSVGIIALPGPNVLFIVATSLAGGRRAGLVAVAGTSSAMAVQLCVAAIGTAALASLLADAFVWVKWAGVAYLAYLGLTHLIDARRGPESALNTASVGRSFWRGFLVSLTNPKTILFFGAFLPQFVSGAYPPAPQLALLSVSFFMLAVALDSVYALGASAVRRFVERPAYARGRNVVVGLIYLGASVGLAATRRTAA